MTQDKRDSHEASPDAPRYRWTGSQVRRPRGVQFLLPWRAAVAQRHKHDVATWPQSLDKGRAPWSPWRTSSQR